MAVLPKGNTNDQIHFTNGIRMMYLLAQIIKWKRGKSTHRYTRNDEFSAKLTDVSSTTIYTVISLYINLLISN
jgi:hypothetical protein